MMISVYADESCKDNHKHLILGGVCLKLEQVEEVNKQLLDVRTKHNTYGEVKWGKVSKSKHAFYEDYISVFFNLCSLDVLHFHFLSVDTSTFNHRLHNDGSSELGFDKLIYQLLLHKFGARYGHKHKIQVYLDERTTKNNPNEMTEMLNAGLNKKVNINTNPFSRVTFQNSKTSEILQLNDLLIGAIGFRKNKRHLKHDSATHKVAFSELIARKALMLERPIKMSSPSAVKFTSWDFKFRKCSSSLGFHHPS
jgi:Protein of unknown function (DUF3800)